MSQAIHLIDFQETNTLNNI